MLRVTIDYVPVSAGKRQRTLGTVEIINTLTGNLLTGHYDVLLKREEVKENQLPLTTVRCSVARGDYLTCVKQCIAAALEAEMEAISD